MAAPTFVAEYETAWNTGTTPKTVSVTTAVGDVLVISSGVEANSTAIAAPTGGTPTYALQETLSPASFCALRAYTALTGITAQTYTLSQTTDSGTTWWGFNCLRFSGSSGIGAAESGSGNGTAPSLAITATQDDSALVVFCYDWNAADGASRAWQAVNGTTPTAGNGFEVSYFRDGSHYTVYGAYYPNAGVAGAKTVGLTTPSQKWVLSAIEVKGTASAATSLPAFRPRRMGALLDL